MERDSKCFEVDLEIEEVVQGLNIASERIYSDNEKKGFWPPEGRNIPECICLIHSELSEALEGLRKNRRAEFSTSENLVPDSMTKEEFIKKIKDSFEDELADTAIRIFDLCGALQIDIDGHINAKLAFNKTRPPKHGKAF